VLSITTFDELAMGFAKQTLLCQNKGFPSAECGCGPDIPSPPWLLKHAISIRLRVPLCVRNTAISVITTMRLPKELCTRKKGKAFNFLSLIIRVKLEIL